jgi:hypothetical protein
MSPMKNSKVLYSKVETRRAPYQKVRAITKNLECGSVSYKLYRQTEEEPTRQLARLRITYCSKWRIYSTAEVALRDSCCKFWNSHPRVLERLPFGSRLLLHKQLGQIVRELFC